MPSPAHPPTDTGAIGAERSVLEGLLARVEAASGPDRYADCWLACAFDGFFPVPKQWPELDGEMTWRMDFCRHDGDGFVSPGHGGDQMVREYTASLDAALALCNRVLPGWTRMIDENFGVGEQTVWTGYVFTPRDARCAQFEGYSKAPAVALVAAMLRALIAQAPSPATTPTGVLETSLIVEGDSSVAESARTGPVARPDTNPLQVDKGEDR